MGLSNSIEGGSADTHRIIRGVLAIRDPGMRLLSLARALTRLEPNEVLALLETLQHQSVQGSAEARAVLIELSRFNPDAGIPTLEALDGWRAQAEATHSDALPMLAAQPPRLVAYAPHGVNINEQLEDTPLGRRKAMARGRNRQLLDRLLSDKHPDVVAILLGNSRIIERDVVQMAASRPTSAPALNTIARHPKWIKRYAVRSALTQNPYTPPALAIRLMPTLSLTELRRIATNLKLHPSVQDRARALAAERGVSIRHRAEHTKGSELRVDALEAAKGEETELEHAAHILAEAMASVSARRHPLKRGSASLKPTALDTQTSAERQAQGDDNDDAAIAADFLANLGPLTLVPVSEGAAQGDEASPPALPFSATTSGSTLDEADWGDVHIVAVPGMETKAPSPEDEHAPWEEPPPPPGEADAIAEAFMANLTITLVPVGETDS